MILEHMWRASFEKDVQVGSAEIGDWILDILKLQDNTAYFSKAT